MRAVLALLALILLVSCETTPPPPLLSPLAEVGRYGYAERQTGPASWEVTYVGPVRRSSPFSTGREADAALARAQAFDFMLWRAAQIAENEGFPAFRVRQSRSNLETHIEDYPDPFWGPPFGPFFGPPYYRRRGFGHFPYHYPYGGAPLAYLQARVSADIDLLRAAAPGDYVPADVIRQARQTYPAGEGPVAAR
jgi:hypothetical protein